MADERVDSKPEISIQSQVNIQFRTADIGDLGPYTFPGSTNAQAMKERLFQDWPKQGTEAAAKIQANPTAPNDFRLILGGRSLDPHDTLAQSSFVQLGENKPDTLVTIHVVVRPGMSQSQKAGKYAVESDRSPGCNCCIQ